MRANEYHLVAISRLLALIAADGNIQEAERNIQWAYDSKQCGNEESNERKTKRREEKNLATNGFITEFLTPESNLSTQTISKFIRKYIEGKGMRGLNKKAIKKHIEEMTYDDFLKTPYWISISTSVKSRDGKKCVFCGSKEKLQVHHTTYEHHGEEINHLGDLICVCSTCHKKVHEK